MDKSLINIKETYIWLLLAGLTFVAWVIGSKYNLLAPEHYKYMTVAALVLAFFKVRLVILYFMEIKSAPWALRLVFEGWLVMTCASLSFLYFMIPA